MKTNLLPGIGANVLDGKLSSAIRIWKNELSDSGIIQTLRERNNGYVKPSKKRREIIELAKYKEKFRT